MNNYCVCYRIENDIEDNLFYIKGIIHSLSFFNRNYDIYIDLSQKSYNILNEIIAKEKLYNNDLYFNIHEDYINKKIWNIHTFLNKAHLYDIIAIKDSSCECGENELSKIIDKKYSLYTYIQTIENYISFGWSYESLLFNSIYLKFKNFNIIEYDKILSLFNEIYKSKIPKNNNFTLRFLNSLFINQLYRNEVLYLYNKKNIKNDYIKKYTNTYYYDNIEWYWLKKDIRKSINFKNNKYFLNNREFIYDYNEPVNLENNYNLEYYNVIYKHLFLQIEKINLGLINKIDFKIYENDFNILK